MTTTVGVSLKMYFSHARTMEYCGALRDIAVGEPELLDGDTELVVLPTFVSVPGAIDAFRGSPVRVGAQDLAAADDGAFTGEVSGAELAEIGCTHVEVGHAERRTLFGEDDATVTAKATAAWRNGLVPLLCVGEPGQIDPDDAGDVCVAQVRSALGAAAEAGLTGRVLVAYEPYWAIGAPQPAPTDYVIAVCDRIRAELTSELDDFAILYGGSAGPGLLTELGGAVDGLFLGRFAHDPEAVRSVLREAAARSQD